jgi:6-phosphogluconolactonase
VSEPSVVILPDPAAVAAEAADRIAAALAGAVAERGRAEWATTGGSTPVPIYRLLASSPRRDRVPWEHVHTWWGDDRFDPSTDALSNAAPAREHLLGPLGVPESHVHAVPADASLAAGETADACAARYEAELRSSGIEAAGGWPVFDLVIVGIGSDGHLLSVFPGSAAFDRSEWVLGIPAPTHIEPHVPRVTLNPRILDVARTLLVVVHGTGKATILGDVFGQVRDERRWPAQVARRAGATWILDAAAAERLPSKVDG